MGRQTYSLERSFIQTRLTNAELLSYLNVTISNDLGAKMKDVKVFTNMEYNFTFYDASTGSRRSITGLVLDVFTDQIKVKTIHNSDKKKPNCNLCDKKHNCKDYHLFMKTNQPPMPTCNCVLNPPDTSKYNETEIIFIPLANLIDVSYILSDNGQNKKPKGGTKVLLLGISATMVKAIVIHLEFFDDSIENAVKYVNLEKDGIYDITYMSRNGIIFEVRAKIAEITELPHPDHAPHHHGPTVVRENIGAKNSVYAGYEDDCCTTKHDFMKQPPAPPVKIIMDTSDTFEGRYETIMLDQIRGCSTVYSPSENGEGVIEDSSEPNCCECCDKNQKFEYKYEDGSKAIINGDNVSLVVNGSKTDLSLDDLVKFYLGIG